ncbi:GNAT family N-acetyltransferase [Deinococcus sp. HMF7620]|uniref:GNAT family N-acetyltransferase n=1 Tax=Deinococcus arboris TaxID=2682977 RepID=A0A7C9M9C7_9DEIO|nr:GNAT family protein [Deinococcus arboris]MVN89285.1 GNAT family N-acetyltransferase [Deinococcus arboris]
MTVALRPLHRGDEEAAVHWAADPEFCRAAGWTPGLAARVVRRHWQSLIAARDPTFRRFGLTLDGRLVGYADLADLTAQSGELGIAVGERALWGQGIAAQGCRALLAWAWAQELQGVTAQVHEPNARSHALLARLGFQAVGWGPPEPYQGEVVPVRHYRLVRPG